MHMSLTHLLSQAAGSDGFWRAPATPAPPHVAPAVPQAPVPQVPSHAPSAPQVLRLEDALAPAVHQAAALAAAQAVAASHEEQVAAANAFASASALTAPREAPEQLASKGSTGHHLGQCRRGGA